MILKIRECFCLLDDRCIPVSSNFEIIEKIACVTLEKAACCSFSAHNVSRRGTVTQQHLFSEISAGKWRTMGEESEGISFLFSKLCELSFNNEANERWDIYRRPRFTNRRQKALQLCLYETLFEELRAPWVDQLKRTQYKGYKSRFHVVDKLSIAAFELRIARRFDDADKLERFLCQWRNLEGW